MTVARALTTTTASANAATATATIASGSFATGDLLVCYGEILGNTETLTLTDNVGDSNQNNWTLLSGPYYATPVGVRMYVWYRVVGSSPGAGKSFTVTRSGSTWITVAIHSYRNDVTTGLTWSLATSNAGATGSGSTTQTTPTLTYAGTNNVVFNVLTSDRVETATAPLTKQSNGFINGGASGDAFNQTSTTTPTWTSGANANWGSISGVFRAIVDVGVVQQWSGNNTAGTNVQSLTSVPAAGNLLVWYAEVDNGTATLTFSDNMTDGGTWQHVTGSPLTFAAGPAKGYLLWKVVGATANTGKQRTATVSAGTPNVESWCVEVTVGNGYSWSVDAVTAATGSSNTPNSANALTLTSALNFCVGTVASDRARTAVAPCTSRVATAAYFYSGIEDAYNQSTSITPQWTVGVSTAWMCFGAAFKATPAPQITGGTAAPVHLSTGNTVTGVNFGASQTGSAALAIGSTGQTETAWGDTSVTYTADRGINGNGVAVNAILTESGGQASSNYILTGFQPPAGWTSVTLVSVEADPAMRLQSSADLAIGNQIEWDDATIEVTDSGVPIWPPGTPAGYTFNFRVWVSGSGWGATEVATLNPAASGGDLVASIMHRFRRLAMR